MFTEKGPPPEEMGIKTGDPEVHEKQEESNIVSEETIRLARNLFYEKDKQEKAQEFSSIINDIAKEEIELIESSQVEPTERKKITLDLLSKLSRGLTSANESRNPDEVLAANYNPKEEGNENYIQKKDLPIILKGLIAGDLLKLNVTDGMFGSSPRIGMAIRRFSELRDIPPQEAIEKFQNILQQTRNHLEALGKGGEGYLDSGLKEWGIKRDINKNAYTYTYHEQNVPSLHETYPNKF